MSSRFLSDEVPLNINFVDTEEQVLELWKEIKAFETSTKLSKGRKHYSFYDGPPFATGLPHYGHILAGTIKDVVTRYAYQTGHHVTRRFGWDCHGLPVEHEIDKLHNIKSPADVLNMGITKYNDACRSIVSRYAKEWEDVVNRFGRWIDFENDYKTMYPSFMESVWWVFKQVFDKGLVYRSFRVMPFSTACTTPLSNFETGQNYKDIVDPSIIIRFVDSEDENISYLAWTTTPWTLPSNMALVVNPDKIYVKIRDKNLKMYVLMESRVSHVFKSPFEIVDKFPGSALVGKSYIPLFKYFSGFENAFKIYADPYVTDATGTGIVHSAPAFGEDDLRVCQNNHVVSNDRQLPCPIDVSGNFIDPVTDFKGMNFKDANPLIISNLKERKLLFGHSNITHSYPFCWRSDTPIMYRAVPSWFIKVENIVTDLLKNNKKSTWIPEYVRSKRFHNWLENARDWNVSRNRYWGTPIPLWVNDDFSEIICVGSIDELSQLSGVKVTDLHRENIDNIKIKSKTGQGYLHRTSEVFDCWFESGSMPYAQIHYPFENNDLFESYFPADFVAEGIDQTRGWFYTLLVISTCLFNETPFKNVVVSGLVLSSDGEKMSKRKKNYPDPLDMVNKYGADCIRAYLINSPVVNGENLNFKESGLSSLLKELFLPWFNAFRFFSQYRCVYEKKNSKFMFDPKNLEKLDSLLDVWMLSYSQSFIRDFRDEMSKYRLYNLVPNLQAYVDTLTKWYIRMNRLNLKGDAGNQLTSLTVLYKCLLDFAISAAPVTPFICEYYFQHLKKYLTDCSDEVGKSVHFQMIPQVESKFIFLDLERTFVNFRHVVELCRKIRERNNLPMKHPLSRVIVVHPEASFHEGMKLLEEYLLEDINVKEIVYTTDHTCHGLSLAIEPNYRLLGKRLGKNLKDIISEINSFSQEKLLESLKEGVINIRSELITAEEVHIFYKIDNDKKAGNIDVCTLKELAVLLDTKPNSELEDEGIARDFVNKIQRLRKKAKLNPTDDIIISYSILKSESEADLQRFSRVLLNNKAKIEDIIKRPIIQEFGDSLNSSDKVIASETFDLAKNTFSLSLINPS
ncbi:Isoleucine--tRNA ligase, cytoplasmic [Thelohanellus kitauei]|uniref:isoleucine--tRNA ligase n=1 Tax=Thelohanellus kitauei TaxID=669202 RepID=A0A0C2IPN3_THEKT|nr:Isoleucine--tRNA ligase, cytoplasmic [Thelohanellus kitauei]